MLGGVHGILVPGGFGDRGIEGMICAIKYARENKIPYLGICLGMQLTLVEFGRHVLGFADAHSKEFNPETTHPMVHMPWILLLIHMDKILNVKFLQDL